MAVVFLDPLADPEWDLRLEGVPGATVFHSRAWAAVLARAYGFPRQYATVEQGHDLQAMLPIVEVPFIGLKSRAVSLPFSDHVPAVAVDRAAASSMLKQVLALGGARGWRSLELRGGVCDQPGAVPSGRYYRHELSLLTDESEMFARLKATVRTAVRKAEASGVTIERTQGGSGLVRFLRLNERTRRRHGVPPQPAKFFAALDDVILGPQIGEIWLAAQAGRPLGAALFLRHGAQVTFKYGCSDERFQNLRANDLLMWRAICDFAGRGIQRLCLGRTDLHHEGLRRFKAGFGAMEERLDYHQYDFKRAAFTAEAGDKSAWYGGVFRIMPLWMNRFLGKLLYRYAA
ncbi:MAG: GNAT family N-acetyltransferase [Lentisphaerae bacterium]|nr:GNAT family N-acetyltransferase [Lentisphaerota bacterium]